MNFNIKVVSISLVSFFAMQGCVEYREDPICKELNYMTFEEFRAKGIEILAPKEIKKAEKIYVYQNTLFVAEKNQGIHVIDNSDKKNPNPKAFIKIAGNLDMAVKDGYLYLDSYMDLVVVDIKNLDSIKEVNRVTDTFTYDAYQDYTYDCDFNLSNGVIVGGEIE